ncbi:MAG: flippase-like domain-containing protein [Candidatus Fermentibacteraceae bacterium]|nr:flippase-like domain-containing protein [Candidatus Fermentibacteraceae bacterium]MBN2607812.1 flippase-like domain-containing protein [Candidatus Fermentibacteraceae bacterium]
MKYSKKATGAIFGTLIGLALAWILLRSSAGEEGIASALENILRRTAGADRLLLVGAFALFLASQALRAVRWMLLGFRRRYRFSLSMAVTSIHVGLGHLLPFRLADVAFVGLFRHFGEVPVGHGTASVVMAKLLDLMAMGAVIGSAAAAGVGDLAFVAPVIALAGFAGIIFLSPILRALGVPVRWILERFFHGRKTHWFDDLVSASSVRGRKFNLTMAFLVSILVWVAKLSMFLLMLEALGVTGVPGWKIFLASGITNIIMALPINGILSIGTTEAGWTAAFAMVGVGGSISSNFDIVELGFSVHILWMIMAVVLMLLAIPLLIRDGRRRRIE